MCYSSKVHDDPLQKSMDQMNCDLELVYVGQLCLSWEILTWFSAKTRQLICYDSQAKRSFGHAAERFQQFQVVLQRFVEEERFARERIPNYIQWRRVASNLLHVPNIKDDDSKVSKQEETDGNNAITIRDLVEVLDESQSIFRDFLFADIKSKNVVAGSSSSSSDLLSSIVTTLRRKEREWKKRKGRKQQERCRFEEVQVRVVSRVMNMSRVSVDQLLWCKTKLDAMGGGTTGEVGGFHSEPSFLIFPC
ncbi:hypothetical protein M569_08220 [Genlisea aurea]|uniref:Uncharacterized protein n=1 Tax=Genlisea aurea TaxID=192259 RepID=S8CP09_9LAMI|nr:hypothetical protein M569_08220 [Genlisea aurea]